mgnify:CR=1 FL=1
MSTLFLKGSQAAISWAKPCPTVVTLSKGVTTDFSPIKKEMCALSELNNLSLLTSSSAKSFLTSYLLPQGGGAKRLPISCASSGGASSRKSLSFIHLR